MRAIELKHASIDGASVPKQRRTDWGAKVGWSEIARHRGYAILVFAWSPLGENTFKATYNILGHYGRSKAVLFQGVVAGAYQSAEAAQEAATERAKKWIDEQ